MLQRCGLTFLNDPRHYIYQLSSCLSIPNDRIPTSDPPRYLFDKSVRFDEFRYFTGELLESRFIFKTSGAELKD